MSYVVVGTTKGDCEQAEDRDCVSWVHGPFETNEEAKQYMKWIPSGFNAHAMQLENVIRAPGG